ncbi:hypothetical protein JCM11251_001740 [Rhodosporidiobolus azoricus]
MIPRPKPALKTQRPVFKEIANLVPQPSDPATHKELLAARGCRKTYSAALEADKEHGIDELQDLARLDEFVSVLEVDVTGQTSTPAWAMASEARLKAHVTSEVKKVNDGMEKKYKALDKKVDKLSKQVETLSTDFKNLPLSVTSLIECRGIPINNRLTRGGDYKFPPNWEGKQFDHDDIPDVVFRDGTIAKASIDNLPDDVVKKALKHYNRTTTGSVGAKRERLPSSFHPTLLDASNAPASTTAELRPPLPPAVAGWALRKAVASGLSKAGFEGAEEEAYLELEGAVYEYFGALLTYASQLAEHGRRHEPTLSDVVQASWELGVGGAGELVQEMQKAKERREEAPDIHITYKRPRLPSPPPRLLPSDDESDPLPPHLLSPPPSPPQSPHTSDDEDADFEEVLPLGPDGKPLPSAVAEQDARKKMKEEKRDKRDKVRREREERGKEREKRRRLRKRREEADPFRAGWLPTLPPKHSWKQTPVYPESAAPPPIPPPISQTQQAPSAAALQHLSTLRARLNDSQLVAASLRNLIRRTGARAVAPAGVGGGGGGGGVAGEEQRAQQEALLQEAQDVVDYESEWYGVKEASAAALVLPGGGGKRRIRVLTVGADREEDEDGNEGEEGEKEKREQGEGSRVGGAAKRRRWLV